MVPAIVEASVLPGYKLHIRFADGVEGDVDVSDLVGKGVFAAWRDPAAFARVFIDPESRTVAWPGAIELCPVELHEEILHPTQTCPSTEPRPHRDR